MSLKIQLLRGTTAQNDAYVGKNGELTIDVSTRSLRIHDGSTAGGFTVLGNQQVQNFINELADRIDENDADIVTINNAIDGINTSLDTKFDKLMVGQASGAASLDASGKVPLSQLSDAVLGQVIYMGAWNAGTNTPTLPLYPENKGDYWIVDAPGTFADMEFNIGDWIISDGAEWQKVDNTDAVASVAGKTGVVLLNKADVGLANVDNTSDLDKPVSTAQQTALDAKVDQTEYDTFKSTVEDMDTGVSTVSGSGPVSVDSTDTANPVVGIANATPTSDGAMSSEDKTKLDTVESGAQVNTVLSVAGRTDHVTLDKGDVGLSNVENLQIATPTEGVEGNINTKYVTPVRVRGFVEGMGFEQDAGSGEWTLDQGSM